MKVLISVFADRGGGIANFLQLVRAVIVGHPRDQFTLVCPETSKFVELGRQDNVTIVAVPTGTAKELRRLHLGMIGLRRIARRQLADVIWSLNHGPYCPTGAAHVLSVNNPHQVYPWVDTRSHPRSRFFRMMLRWFFRRSLAHSQGVIVQTELMKQYVGQLPMAPTRCVVIAKAVESSQTEAAPLPGEVVRLLEGGLGWEAFTFLYVATLIPHKNHETLLAAIDMVRTAGTPARVVLTLTEQEVTRIGGETTRSLVASGHVVPVGWIQSEHLRTLYDACDACVMPSILESLSSAHLEAMQWGKPQVVADMPYAHDLCGEAALYASSIAPADWEAKMQRLARDSRLQSHLVEAGYQRMRDFPRTWEEVACSVREFLASFTNST